MRARRRRAAGGFTLLEVMIALLLAMIGLLGTIAIQQTMMNATASINDAAIATRLATQTLEEYSVRRTIPPAPIDFLSPDITATWRPPVFMNDRGQVNNPPGTQTPAFRFQRETWVRRAVGPLPAGMAFQPINISVRITYNMDGNRKVLQMDVERRVSW